MNQQIGRLKIRTWNKKRHFDPTGKTSGAENMLSKQAANVLVTMDSTESGLAVDSVIAFGVHGTIAVTA